MDRTFASVVGRFLTVIGLASALSACKDGSGSSGPGADGGAPGGAITYYWDIAPLFREKCVKCHQPGGIGPVRLDTYADVKRHGPTVQFLTSVRTMPPFLVSRDSSCGSFEDGEALTDAQIATIGRWVDEGMAEGTPAAAPPVPLPGIGDGTEYRTPMLAPVRAGGRLAEHDEYRCFPVASSLDRERFITAYEVVPGNPALVHHAMMFLVDPDRRPATGGGRTNAELMQALDARDDRPGWPCFSLAGDGVEIEAIPVVWAPGQGVVDYPRGLGVRQRRTDRVVVQLHYNLADPKLMGMTDSTVVRVRHTDVVARRAVFLVEDAFLETIARPSGPDAIPAMSESFEYTWKRSARELGLGELPAVDLVGVMPHMHERGRKKHLTIVGADGGRRCAARVENWDFNWQKFYFYREPLPLGPASQLELTCTYSTADDTMPVLPGWGTRNEMCTAILMLALPPGT